MEKKPLISNKETSEMEHKQTDDLIADTTSHAEMKNQLLGKPGTFQRDWFEQCLFAVPAPVLGAVAKVGM